MAWVVISQFVDIIYFSEIYKNNTKRKFEFGDNLMKVLVFNPFNVMAGTFTNRCMVAGGPQKVSERRMTHCHS